MKYRILAAACVAYSLALLAAFHLAPPVSRYGLAAGYGLAGVAGLVTGFSYAAKDRLRWAWVSIGSAYLISFASKVLLGDNSAVPTFTPTKAALFGAAVLLLNIGSVTGLVLFARVWSGTGLAPAWRGRATLIFLAVAIALDGPGLYAGVRAIAGGNHAGIGALISSAGDLTAIALVGPIFATAVALRGGIISRPWLFMFFATVSWLFDDIAFALPPRIGFNVDVVVRSLALMLTAAAAIAQLWVKREVRSSLEEA